jgi:uncharacterized protein (DUF2336 family)
LINAGDAATLRLIARRRHLSPALTDALIGHGDASVLLAVVRNPGASLSPEAFQVLAESAKSRTSLQAPLATRPDTPAPIAFELFWSLPPQLRRYVLSRFLDGVGHLGPDPEDRPCARRVERQRERREFQDRRQGRVSTNS